MFKASNKKQTNHTWVRSLENILRKTNVKWSFENQSYIILNANIMLYNNKI